MDPQLGKILCEISNLEEFLGKILEQKSCKSLDSETGDTGHKLAGASTRDTRDL